ncbi:AI-2E family transporter [Leucobacter chromiiresistens]|uniref:Predicted PurR-regulated permease PerM n=1 Tax=Leucobacter chromiiresistens TaxID=1079994 RepID=A0A1H0YYB0_9MICO|nr:AI-2E family transporter [Leucobacter chromiiresistens]SDQ20175.1 Predicted PurR-regulated permease PerM [Leucobacter chromiiresistens]
MTDPQNSRDAAGAGDAAHELPLGVRVAAAWSWRLVLIGIALAGFLWLVVQVRIIVIPVLVAILLTALLAPVVHWFERQKLPRWLGVVFALALFIALVWVLLTLIITQLRDGLGDVASRSEEVWWEMLRWAEATFGISANEIGAFTDQLWKTVDEHQSELWNGALGVATSAGQFVAGLLLTIFSLIFMLIDGRRIWNWVLGFLPARAHAPVDAAGRAGWVSVGQYVRVQIFVAFVDAVGIGVGAAVLGVPLAIPIAILVFLGSFIPFLGAISTGLLAAFVALVYNGPVTALLMLGVVILVNQIEGHVLQPLVMGSAVRVHPLGVVLAVSTGALLAGIPGALFAVPLAAAANSVVNVLVKRQWETGVDPVAEYHRRYQLHHRAKHRARAVARMRRKEGRS